MEEEFSEKEDRRKGFKGGGTVKYCTECQLRSKDEAEIHAINGVGCSSISLGKQNRFRILELREEKKIQPFPFARLIERPQCNRQRPGAFYNIACHCCYCGPSSNDDSNIREDKRPTYPTKEPVHFMLKKREVDHIWIPQNELEELLICDLSAFYSPTPEELEQILEQQKPVGKGDFVQWVIIYQDAWHLSGPESEMAAQRMTDKLARKKIPYLVVETGGTGLKGRQCTCDPSSMEYVPRRDRSCKAKGKNKGDKKERELALHPDEDFVSR